MSDNNQRCENCDADELTAFIDRPNHRLLHCKRCNLYQKGTLESAALYEGDYHDCYSGRKKSKTTTAAIRLAAATPYLPTPNPRTLDIGCSVGATVQASKDFGWDAFGVDISQTAVKFCQANELNCHKIDGLKLPFKDEHFDLVTHWHVIEHVDDVAATLVEWTRVLKPGGIMMMETPDSRFLKAKILGAKYKKFWPVEHLYTFDPDNMAKIMEDAGLEVLPNRTLGKWSALPPHLNLYALGYRGLRKAYRALRLCKSFEMICRKPVAHTNKLAKAA